MRPESGPLNSSDSVWAPGLYGYVYKGYVRGPLLTAQIQGPCNYPKSYAGVGFEAPKAFEAFKDLTWFVWAFWGFELRAVGLYYYIGFLKLSMAGELYLGARRGLS